jgi:hypothetical protein
MQSVAAYYVLVASEVANDASARVRYEHAPKKRSRLAELFGSVTRPVRRTAAAAA